MNRVPGGDFSHGFDNLTDESVRARMLRGWDGESTTRCGSGSTYDATDNVRRLLEALVLDEGITTIADAGAGDLGWVKTIVWPRPVKYRAFDLVPRVPAVQEFDITKQILPASDLIICRFVLNHLSVRMARDALTRFVESNSRLLLISMSASVAAYWAEHGMKIRRPLNTWNDTGKYWVELHPLSRHPIIEWPREVRDVG